MWARQISVKLECCGVLLTADALRSVPTTVDRNRITLNPKTSDATVGEQCLAAGGAVRCLVPGTIGHLAIRTQHLNTRLTGFVDANADPGMTVRI